MFEEYLGKIVCITTGSEGETTEYNLQLTEVDGTLIKVQDSNGNTRVINTTSSNFSEIRLQD